VIGNSAFLAAMILLVTVFTVAQQVTFLAPYKRLLFDRYLVTLLVSAGVLYLNLFAGCYLVSRRLLLKETGRKLAHLERQLQSGDSIVRDLSERLAAEE
jgi:hypothetical protein